MKLGRPVEALQECNRALESAPDHAEFFRSRAFIRASQGLTQGLEDDLDRFEVLCRLLPRTFWRNPALQRLGDPRPAIVPGSRRALALATPRDVEPSQGDPFGEPGEIDYDELDARAVLATTIHEAGKIETAAVELEKILALEPDYLYARLMRGLQAIETRRFEEARTDLKAVLNHSRLLELLHKEPGLILTLHDVSRRYARHGLIDEAIEIAEDALSYANLLKQHQGRSNYMLARVYALAAKSDPCCIPLVAQQLQFAFIAHSTFKKWYESDANFHAVRTQVNALLDQMPDPNPS
jgi:tetratricopeptide (TPR) repeat protein